MQHLVEGPDLREARLGRPDCRRSLAQAAPPPSKMVLVTSSRLIPCRLRTPRTLANVPTLSIMRMTSWKRDAVADTFTTFGTAPSSRNDRMTRTVSVAIASCAWSVAAAMCGVP